DTDRLPPAAARRCGTPTGPPVRIHPAPAGPPSGETARGAGDTGNARDAEAAGDLGGGEARHDGTAAEPLPKRVRQASLVPELRKPAARRAAAPDEDTLTLRPEPARSGAAIGAFQRQSRIARQQAAPDAPSTTGGSTPGRSRPKTEDRT
ncbi:hypothetical protein ACLIYP_25780, partial [Streptomyces nanhaiensis]